MQVVLRTIHARGTQNLERRLRTNEIRTGTSLGALGSYVSAPYFSGMDNRDITWNCLLDRSEGAFHSFGKRPPYQRKQKLPDLMFDFA